MNAYVFPNIWLSHGLRNFIETQRPVLLFITINNNKRNSTVELQLLITPIQSDLQIHQPQSVLQWPKYTFEKVFRVS